MGSVVLAREMNRLCKIALMIFLLLGVEAFAGWTEPVNMGPKINSYELDADPCISTDGKFFFLARIGPGGLQDIYFSEMTDTGWTNSQRLPNPVNSNATDLGPFFTRDGTRLYLASERAGSMGWLDIWYVDYDTLTGEWGEPAVCDTPLNSAHSEAGMSLTGENSKIYFHNSGPLGPLTVATWNGANWGNLTPLNTLIHNWTEDDPDIVPDGNIIYFGRWLLHIGMQIFYSTKYDTCDDCWNEPIRLPDIINDPPAMDPFISHDGTRLYFVTERPGGFGSCDIYYSDYVTDADEDFEHAPTTIELKAYPNPFNSATAISLYAPRIMEGNFELNVYGVGGRIVKRLFTSTSMSGNKTVIWDGRADDNKCVSSGVYFCLLLSGRTILKSEKIVLIR
jgi:hypothetical protein